ncbi:hypothetical protein B0T17DRAFT_590366 [Bombardia bombarda]|uniref:Amine oxidase domain-containing protein n=1 Tax=Bombardia bombarda TaxID=252184 RepID=A0AA39XBX8_9PEZI|nr:hypothetical protein B0T17DRAFT_590366 [Bombardia bombarda]
MDQTAADVPKRHVGVVGAGISGLRCADILLSHGFDVTILEARNRIGGRVRILGPNWIHAWTDSDEPHPIYKLAADTNTPVHRWNNKQLIFDSAGNPLDAELTERLSTLLWDIIEEAFTFSEAAHTKDGGKSIPSNDSLQDFVRRRAEERVPDDMERGLLVQMSEMFGAYVGEPVWKQSLRFAWMEECCGGEEMFVASNYANILARAAAPAVRSARILLNQRVVSVTIPQDRDLSLPDQPDQPQKQLVVRTLSGDTFSFDEVVMTTPLGFLQRHHASLFTPALPLRLISAIESLSLSQLEKVYITFPSVWWTSETPNTEFPCYTNWLTPSYLPATLTSPLPPHPQEMWDLSAFAPPNAHPTLLFYLYGDLSRHIVSLIYGRPSTEKHALLETFFRPYFSLLPGYDANKSECVPKAILATEWLKDELNGYGSYCNFQVGVEAADEDVLRIREGCGRDRGLWFCGEHAAPFEECGTVAGAYLSGEGVGKRIVGLYKGDGGKGADEVVGDGRK